ncbi:class A rhodopsin-like G-protein coupled receptor GPRgph, putative [Pediculus humanus corporis]|uniref:Class A rhodopsin-like G-protein coupled receptor GPRgph, putative n=1 Tax=Pediculus humanus subsp. corporis TaxID=121224 RepID=E0VC99_PEDHC|nr:class A rhodopsin-like G-protein coupled receptor GPRgph, putative [Pediculus humanus corporis]EEB11021.1 class A rhodopsin-like G-protein coupled receptor GPRgph, putative [Pediculus humanus corporis]
MFFFFFFFFLETFQCSKSQFKCGNGFCISREHLCNFEDDCGDLTDETDCKYRECWPSEFRCDNQECIRPGMVCDNVPDCRDSSDETGCLSETCDDGKKIHKNTKCNGWPDCDDHKDELNCKLNLRNCDLSSGNYFQCPNTRCLRKSRICDGICDCLGETPCFDEINCDDYYTIVNGYQMCRVGSTISCRTTISGVTIERCISHEYICDGFNDCLNGNNNLSDEYGCVSGVDVWKNILEPNGEKFIFCGGLDQRKLSHSFICNYQIDCLNGEDELDCVWPNCTENEFQCDNGYCIPIRDRCNAQIDCSDKSDEINCTGFKCIVDIRDLDEKSNKLKQCDNGQCINSNFWCDFIQDCSDGSDENNCGNQKEFCTGNEFKCETSGQCIPKNEYCYKNENLRQGCADKSHLKGCANFTCPEGTFKCKMGPCLHTSLLCDGKFDCLDFWMDEKNCTHECFEFCTCIDITANCTGLGLQTIKNIDKMEDPYRKFYFANNNLSKVLNENFTYNIRFAILLDLSNNSICSITPGIFKDLRDLKTFVLQNNCITVLESQTFDGLSNLNGLHLEGNKIQTIKEKAFYGLSSLPTLNLKHQLIKHIAEGGFIGLRKLSNLDLSQNKIEILYHGTFQGLQKLTHLDLRGNPLRKLESDVFKRPELSIQVLLFDNFKFCCLAKHVPNCQPTSDEFSVCEDLMGNFVLRVCIWVLGIIASFGNLLVIGWRMNYKHKNKVHSFLITNLAVGDFLMGFYLLIIASVDAHYRGVYSVHDEEWRSSKLCSLAGFLSTLSSELSVFTLILITFESFLVIMFPFKVTRLQMSEIRWVMLGVWIAAVCLSGLPLLYKDYFKNFYGRTAVCLALCITIDKNSGWKYSAFIFIFLNFISLILIAMGYIWMYGAAKNTRLAVSRNLESKRMEQVMARRMIFIVATDAACWVPVILLGILSLNGVSVPSQVFAGIAVFVLPLNAAVNPIFYTISTATFLNPAKKNIKRFNNSFRFSPSGCVKNSTTSSIITHP